MTREIVLDTETTGLDPLGGDRIVEIGCVELFNHVPTGSHFHTYINPDRDMPEAAYKVHGLSEQFLSDKPLFAAIREEFLAFLQDSTLIIHNAPFDLGFLNAELAAINFPPLKNPVIDTVELARQKHPGARVGLDALCKHYGIDNSRRTLHGALLDSQILAEVYLELIGGRQVAMALGLSDSQPADQQVIEKKTYAPRKNPAPPLTKQQQSGHARLLQSLGKQPIWNRYSNS